MNKAVGDKMEKVMIEAKNIQKSFGENVILKDISFQIKQGEFVAIMGQSGCGKSTLLYCVSGMDRLSAGEIIFRGRKLTELSDKDMEKQRLLNMGFIFQKANFLKTFSIKDNIIFPAFQAAKRPRDEIVKEAEILMDHMGILPVATQDIRTVSGGQLQRAAICRAMINHTDILFGDEPTGALNSSATKEVMDILGEINRQGMTILLVTHDAKVAARADRVIYLEDGSIKSEFSLGRFEKEEEKEREKRLSTWLSEMGF